MKQKIKFKDLDGWLKLVAILGFINAATISILMFLFFIGIVIGIAAI